jgi:hypothetical protein
VEGQRERDRYGRQSWRERLSEIPSSIRAHPRIAIVAAVFIVGWAIMLLLRPTYVSIGDVAAGDCLYIRPTASVDEFAERASCGGSHSHEVLFVLEIGSIEDPYPDPPSLADEQAACREALSAAGGDDAEPALTSTFVTPSETAWQAGIRTGVCLVERVDGGFLTGPLGAG